MTKWEQFEMEEKIIEVLSMAELYNDHHFKRSFLTPYQIAIELIREYPDICKELEMELGGKGTGLHYSLTQYIARTLSARIENQEIQNVEGAFISTLDLSDMVFRNSDGQEICSSKGDNNTLSMFRIKQS